MYLRRQKPDTLWKKLESLYERKTAQNKAFAIRKLAHLKLKEGRSVAKHLSEFQDLVNQLTRMNLMEDDELQALLLLSSLPDSWETLVVSLSNSTPNGVLQLAMVKDSLFNEETRRKDMGKDDAQALVTENRKEETNQKKADDHNTTAVSLDEDVVVLSIGEDECCHVADPYDEWVIDSAASYHVTPRREFFTSYKARKLRQSKDGYFSSSRNFHAMVERQKGKSLKCLRTDNGGEYTSNEFENYCSEYGIRHEKTVPDTPQHNGVAERINCTIVEKVRCMLRMAKLPKSFWAEDVQTACYLINRSPSVPLDFDIPERVWTGEDASYAHLKKSKSTVEGVSDLTPTSSSSDIATDIEEGEQPIPPEMEEPQVRRSTKGASSINLDTPLLSKKALRNKWVFKLKKDGEKLVKYKARLVVKGFNQKQGIDFDEIFSPVVKMSFIQVILGLTASLDLELEQMDVKTAFLHGDLEEEIYMVQLEGFEAKGKEHKVCRLKKSLYGLKQAPRQWYKKFDSFMVDDMLIVGQDANMVGSLKNELFKSFDMKDLGPARQILGMQILRDRKAKKLWLSQEKYIERVLERFNMKHAKLVSTPLGGHFKLSKKSCPSSNKEKENMASIPYSSAVGSLMYAMVCTRPDIAHAVGVVSRFMVNLGKRALGSSEVDLQIWQVILMVGNLLQGFLFTFVGGAVSWQPKLQKCVTLSTTEAEYIAATEAGKEMLWMKRFLLRLGFEARRLMQLRKIHTDKNPADMLTKVVPKEKLELCAGSSRHEF
uniref:Integrase catalytic domain-containing protein n=1 Tax=Fagus sylvatica TaxID=28930 RepID=A0A2N9FX16_FAGSY